MVTADLLSELMENLKPEAHENLKPGWGVTLPESPRESGTWGMDSVSVLRKKI